MSNFESSILLSPDDRGGGAPPPPPPPLPRTSSSRTSSSFGATAGAGGGQPVELATLALPANAMIGTGLAAGENNHVVLEASNETVEQIQTALLDAAEQQQQQHGVEPPSISAVVDLETLAELAGATEEEFITGLHQELQETRAAAAAAASEEAVGVLLEEEEKAEAGEATPLLMEKEDETTPMVTEQITLPADPFLETLAEVLPQVPEDDTLTLSNSVTTPGDYQTIGGTTTMAAATSVAVIPDGATAALLASGEEEVDQPEEQHFAHDAFLLDIPTTDDQGNKDHHYVLALPEIIIEPSVVTDTSSLGDPFLPFTMLERAMSLLPSTLPSDIEAVHLEATTTTAAAQDDDGTYEMPIISKTGEVEATTAAAVQLDLVVERRVPVIGYLILFSGLFALSSVGAALDLQQGGVTPFMKTLWRQTATCWVLIPMVIKSIRRDGLPKLTLQQWLLLPLASAAYTYMTLAFVIAIDMTTLANAFVLSNMTSLVIIAGRAVLGLPILLLEGVGALTGFIGAAICAQDEGQDIAHEEEERRVLLVDNSMSLWGNLIAFSASFGTAAYLLIAKSLRPKMDLFVFMAIIMGLGALLLLPVMYMIGEVISFDRHPVHGIFGWINPSEMDRLLLELYMAMVCNCLGTTGYIAVMKYFDPIVPATVMLLEPVVGALLGVAAGTALMPGLQTWMGDLVVAGGTFMVIKAGSSKTETIDATEALRPRVDTMALGGMDDAVSLVSSVLKSPLIPRKQNSAKEPSTDETNTKVLWTTE